jgi:hypothetical protein
MLRPALTVLAGLTVGACTSSAPPPSDRQVIPIYSKQSGRLEALVSDRDGDGALDTRAVMDGTRLNRVELDRNADGRPDRWEYYAPDASDPPRIERAEESDGAEGRITRREFYAQGVLDRVEEDTDADGRIDKWERYAAGVLHAVELDLAGGGRPTQRLIYSNGGVARIETDRDGDGVFEAAPRPPAP